ncbi:MAG: RodZ domain-containing protein [Bacillota bacterium]
MGQDRPRGEPASRAAVQPGAMLQAARERLGLSLEAVEEKTRIRQSFLEALEEGRYDHLPGPVYARAFLKLYAQAVGLDPGDVLSAYDQLTGRQAAAAPAARQAGRSRPWWRPDPLLQALEPQRRFRTLAGATTMVVLAALVGAWLLSSATEPRRRQSERPLSAETLPAGPGGAGSPEEAPRVAALPEEQAAELAEPEEPVPAAPSEKAPAEGQGGGMGVPREVSGRAPVAATPSGGEAPAGGSARVPGATGSGIEVVARVVERSWIEAFADGKEVFSGTAQPGEVLSWHADKILSVRFGNAEGVELVVNGVPQGRPGRGVVTKHFFASPKATRP